MAVQHADIGNINYEGFKGNTTFLLNLVSYGIQPYSRYYGPTWFDKLAVDL